MQISIKYSCPIGYGVISCLNKKQAIIRSSGKKNKGAEATKARYFNFKKISDYEPLFKIGGCSENL